MNNLKPNRRQTVVGITTVSALFSTKGQAETAVGNEVSQQSFHLNDLIRQNEANDGPYLQFFDNNTMSAGLYELAAGAEDRQRPHRTDELYYIVRGKARLRAGDEDFDAKPGSIFFVKAQIQHRFIEIIEDLQVLVFFSKADPVG